MTKSLQLDNKLIIKSIKILLQRTEIEQKRERLVAKILHWLRQEQSKSGRTVNIHGKICH